MAEPTVFHPELSQTSTGQNLGDAVIQEERARELVNELIIFPSVVNIIPFGRIQAVQCLVGVVPNISLRRNL